MRILGIDPGTTRIGYGCIEGVSSPALVEYGVLEIGAPETHGRTLELRRRLQGLLDRLHPEVAGVERLFFSRNQKTALSVAEARGIILLSLLERGVRVHEISPGEAKLAVASYALADKRAVASMVAKILRIPPLQGHDDASDALAIAIATGTQEASRRLREL
jgi:crossover junction endodeoxyribonuclease RuvC